MDGYDKEESNDKPDFMLGITSVHLLTYVDQLLAEKHCFI